MTLREFGVQIEICQMLSSMLFTCTNSSSFSDFLIFYSGKIIDTFSLVERTVHWSMLYCLSHSVGYDLLKFWFECHDPTLCLFLVIKVILSHHCKTFLPSYLSGRVCVKLASFLSARVLEVTVGVLEILIQFIDGRSYVLSSIFLE